MKNYSRALSFIIPYTILCIIVLAALRIGTVTIPFQAIFPGHEPEIEHLIFWQRFNRILAAFLAGAILSLCGAVLQTLFHNPLVSPYTLGISGIASLGATLAYILGFKWQWFFINSLQLSAFLFALICLMGMLAIARRYKNEFLLHFILMGVVLNIIAGALILFFRYLVDPYEYMLVDRWLMGSVQVMDFISVVPILVVFLMCVSYFSFSHVRLDILAYGEEIAQSRGINVIRFQYWTILVSALGISVVVSTCGIIGFIGLIIPHAIKLTGVLHHKKLLHLSIVYGGLFLIFSDTLSRRILSPVELPVGILTSIAGGFIFLSILFNRRQKL